MKIETSALFGLVLSLGVTVHVNAGSLRVTHMNSDLQRQSATAWNRSHAVPLTRNWNVLRPFSEIEQTGYVFTNSEDAFEMNGLRQAIAQNLPEGVTLVLYVSDLSEIADLQQEYGQYLGTDRLKFLVVPEGSDMVWSRDSLPFPVYMQPATDSTTPTFGLVASIYPQDFDPNKAVDKGFGIPMTDTQQYFRGGNLLFDLSANCFTENANEVADLSDAQTFFKQYFGCASVTLLDKANGLGDIDERIKFLEGNQVLTDDDNYATILQGKGYEVHRIPQTGFDQETYMNTLYVNGTIFVPQMGIAADKMAVTAYQDLGFKVVPVYTKSMADDGDGNIHCVTMNYPSGAFTPSSRGSQFVEFAKVRKQ